MILLLAALPEEFDAIQKHMEVSEKGILFKRDFVIGKMNHKEVLLAMTGVGKVSTAMTLTHILDKYKIDEIINVGSAGGLVELQNIGDVVIATSGSYHDRYYSDLPDTTESNQFTCDQGMIDHLVPLLEQASMKCHVGKMISGEQFLSQNIPHYHHVQKYFGDAISVDMESTTVMDVASMFNVPVIVIRSLSDVPVHDDHAGQYDQYLEFASAQSALICHLYISNLN